MMLRLVLLLLAASIANAQQSPVLVREGASPQIAVDSRGTIRMVLGRSDSIFVVTSTDDARSFSAPALVAVVPGMHLGNTRGPTIASSANRSAILAIDTKGNLSVFELDHRTSQWQRRSERLNTVDGSAPEGLGTVAADKADNFYFTWLDLRDARQNQIYFARLAKGATEPVTNRKIYASPDGHVCECCRPTVAVAGREVAVMFRNWLGGARDLYVIRSRDAGANFSDAAKLGHGSWKLDACPMDGGAMTISDRGEVVTIWRRELEIYVARPGQAEQRIATGRAPMLASRGAKTVVVWQDGRDIMLRALDTDAATLVGQGRLPQVALLRDGTALVAWERDGKVYFRRV